MSKLFFIVLVSSCTIIYSCKKTSNSDEELTNGIELIQNSSFEMNGVPTEQGWLVDDTSFCKLIKDAPRGGGKWSIKIYAEWTFQHFARTTVAPSEGIHQFELSVYSKKFTIGGSIALFIKRADSLILRKIVFVSDTSWKYCSILDTISIHKPDSLVVVLSGGFTNLPLGYTCFDLCKLKQRN